jgi:hypothetical protein
VISLDAPTAEFVARVLRESPHPEARQAAKKMLAAALESQVRELECEFDNEVPMLCRRMAG